MSQENTSGFRCSSRAANAKEKRQAEVYCWRSNIYWNRCFSRLGACVRPPRVLHPDAQFFSKGLQGQGDRSALADFLGCILRRPIASGLTLLQDDGVHTPAAFSLRALTDRLDVIAWAGTADLQADQRVPSYSWARYCARRLSGHLPAQPRLLRALQGAGSSLCCRPAVCWRRSIRERRAAKRQQLRQGSKAGGNLGQGE